MKRRVLVLVASLGLVVGLTACGGDDPNPTLGGGIDSPGPAQASGKGWPEGIPSEIPQLAGEITQVMSAGSSVRLFYSGVSDAMVEDYVDQLDSLGYDLNYIVYETPSDSGRAQERADAGEWDAVRASNGGYQLNLAFGAGTGTLDIDGVDADAFGPDTSWPEQWPDIPAPGLEITQVLDLGITGPIVEATYGTDEDIVGYVEELEAAGFVVVNRSFDQNDDIISIAVRGQQSEVTLRTYPGNVLEITRIDPADSLLQPSPGGEAAPGADPGFSVAANEFPDWLPEVPGGDIIFASEDPGGGFTASVSIGDDHTVAEYVKVLNDAGFAESDTMIMGHILSDGERTITIFGDDGGLPPLQISIMVTSKP